MANPNIWAPGTSISANSSIATQRFIATEGQTLFNITDFTYALGTNSLYVFVNGGFQVASVDFTEVDSASFELDSGVSAGTVVVAVGFLEIAGGSSVVDAAVAAAEAAQAAAEAALASIGTAVSDAQGFASDAETAALAAEAAEANIATAIANKVDKTSDIGSAILPTGTTAERDLTPQAGWTRFNSTLGKTETYDGTRWITGGGATGGGVDDVFYENSQIVTADYTITSGKNAMSAGPITIADGVTVTIPDGSTWSIT